MATMRMHVVLFEPEIPPNTGNIIRLCANCGAQLHLVEPLGFDIDDRKLRRAGLDYREFVNIKTYNSLNSFIEQVQPGKLYACSTKGTSSYSDVSFQANDALLFDTEGSQAEEFVHLAALQHPHPEKILVLGGGQEYKRNW